MDVRKEGCVIVFVILVCALATGGLEGKQRRAETFFGNGVALEIDDDTAEQVWMNCKQELMDMKEAAVGDLNLHVPQEVISVSIEMNSKSALLTKRDIQEAISVLPPQMKQTLLDCLRKKKFPFRVSGEESASKTWFIKCLELLFVWPNAPRRSLVSELRLKRSASPAPAPGPVVESPSYSPAPSYPAPASSPSPNLLPPTEAPEHPPLPSAFIDSPKTPSAHEHSRPSPHVGLHHPSNNHHDRRKETVIAVTATAVGTFVLLALLFFCCLKGSSNRIGPRDGQKDDRPLLNLSLSDFSNGSSQKSLSLGNSSNKEFSSNSNHFGKMSNLSIVSDVHDSSLAEAPSSEVPPPPLKPPPGRSAPPPPGPPPPPPPISSSIAPAPRPPPPPKGARPPPVPPKLIPGNSRMTKPSPFGPYHQGNSSSGEGDDLNGESEAPKAKLKPFFWDKVLASPDHSMVWHEISSGSFQFNEEMIESLFGYTNVDKNKNERRKEASSLELSTQYIQIIDSKKSQNLSILLRALNVTTEEVCDALQEGNELPPELIQTLLRMAPTTEEELKLRLFSGDLSQLGPAERFLKALVAIPFTFKRLESLLFMSSLQEEVSSIKEYFTTLEVACKELRNSRLFLKLLEAVLKTGNRMNDGTFRGDAQAFKLDTLLKLADVKGTDGKTTLLHFVVQEIIRSEGVRAARAARESQSISSMKSEDFVEETSNNTAEHYCSLGLQVVSGLSNELENVKRAAVIDADGLTTTVSRLGRSLIKTRDFLNSEMNSMEEDSGFHRTLASFVEHAEIDITWLLEEDKRIMALVKSTADYFHGNAGKDEGLRLFMIVRDFLRILDKVCKEVRNSAMMPMRNHRKEASTVPPSPEACHPPLQDIRQRLFPAIADRRMDNSSSDDESLSP